jgi:hypothetical protein
VAREPEWKLEVDVYAPMEESSLGYNFLGFRWVNGESAVGAEMYLHNSLVNAEKTFQGLGESDTSFSFERVKQERIAGLGDDNCLLKVLNSRRGGYCLVLRKGKISTRTELA